jgi:predicted Fe-Mo cluster-binding NifX family protein
MKIAVASQNRRTVTAHPGRCRRFWIYVVDEGRVTQRELLELDRTETLHELAPGLPEALASASVLIADQPCDNLVRRLGRHGIRVLAAADTDPDTAVQMALQPA